MTKLKNNRGFTLIELMIVVAILAVLIAVALPSYQEQIRKARRADVMDALTDCAAAQARNYSTSAPPSYLDEAELVNEALCNPINGLLTSKEEYYTINVENQNCTTNNPDNNTTWCFLLQGVPAAGTTQTSDERCALWTLDHRGNKSAEDSTGNDTTEDCWRK